MCGICFLRGHRLGYLVDEPDVTVVDPNLLRCVPVIAFRPFTYLHPLDEGVQDLTGERGNLRISSRVLQEAADVSGGVLQLLELLRHFRKRLVELCLLLGIVP